MKRKILSVLICMTIVAGTITGCGAKTEDYTIVEETVETEPEVTEEPEVEDTAGEAVETEEVAEAEEETAEAEEETAEAEEETAEAEETAEVEEVSDFSDRENIKLYYNVLNTYSTKNTSVYWACDMDPYDSNDYICTDAMRELESRGYDIDDYTIVNRMGALNNETYTMYPMIIKNTDIDSTREFLWDLFDRNVNTGIDFEPVNNNEKDPSVFLNHILSDVYPKMIADSSYEQIQFEIVDHEYITAFENICGGVTTNEFINAIIYGIFVDKSADVTVFDYGDIINYYVPVSVN